MKNKGRDVHENVQVLGRDLWRRVVQKASGHIINRAFSMRDEMFGRVDVRHIVNNHIKGQMDQ